jgi:D-proline reductase (dithiol) PrdB
MPVEYKTWEFTEGEAGKFQQWMTRVLTGHTGTKDVRNERVNWTSLDKPLSQCMVGLLTTGGVHMKSDVPFDVASAHDDSSFREIPMDIDSSALAITHTHYNHVDADRDVNCMFPLDRLRELQSEGVIGGIAPRAYNIMGFNPDPARLMMETAPEIARRYRQDGVDLLFLTCG